MGAEGPGSMSLARLAEAGGPGALGVAHPFAPDSAYAVSKIFGEMLGKYHATRDATVARDFEFVALRIGWCAYDDPGALEGTVHDEYLPVRLVGWSHNKSKNKDISHVGNAFVIVRRPADRHILAAHRNEGKQNEGKHPQAHAGVCTGGSDAQRGTHSTVVQHQVFGTVGEDGL
jgi:hypothetical protein